MNKFSKGFTLIELLVVIAVLGVLAAGVFTAINPIKRIDQANDARIQSDIGQIAQGLQAYYTTNNGVYPANLAVLETSKDLKKVPVPPGGGSYGYSTNTGATEAELHFAVQDETPIGTAELWCWKSVAAQIVRGVTTCAP